MTDASEEAFRMFESMVLSQWLETYLFLSLKLVIQPMNLNT